jgi:hypothetical protein
MYQFPTDTAGWQYFMAWKEHKSDQPTYYKEVSKAPLVELQL